CAEGGGQDRTATERSRPKFHSPLEPADNLFLGEKLGGHFRDSLQAPIGQLGPAQQSFDFGVTVSWPEKGVVHHIAPLFATPLLQIYPQGCAKGRACIACGWLHPNPTKGAAVAQ